MPEGALQPFAYSVTFSALAAAARLTQSIALGSDADFEAHKCCAYTDATDWETLIIDTSSGRGIVSPLAHGTNVFGTGQRPFILPVAHVFRAGGSIQVDVQNNDGAARDFYLTFWGIKRFR